jgi:hypothetical protein
VQLASAFFVDSPPVFSHLNSALWEISCAFNRMKRRRLSTYRPPELMTHHVRLDGTHPRLRTRSSHSGHVYSGQLRIGNPYTTNDLASQPPGKTYVFE